MYNTLVYSRRIYISTNSNCNLKCIYCYEREKKNLEFNVDEALDILVKLLHTKTEHGTKIKLHGGEPFLSFKKIKFLCESLWKKDLPEYYHFHVTTNGTLIHGEVQEWLYNNRDKITLKLSIDGNKKSNDINRSNSFDQIDIPFFIKAWPNVRANMTITPQTLPYVCENIKFLHHTGIKFIYSRFALFIDWTGINYKTEFYRQLLKLVDFYLENPDIQPCEFFSYDISWTLDKKNDSAPCNVGNMKAYDFQTGKYYPCHMCFPSVCGKEKSEELIKIEMKECVNDSDYRCQICPFSNICQTCYAENYIERGNVSKRNMVLCDYHRLVFAALFKYEYYRILRLVNPQYEDIRKMQAIQKWYPQIVEIEDDILNKDFKRF